MSEIQLGNSNQIVASNGKHYNLELWDAKIQMSCTSWTAGDRLVDIIIVKQYNVCTMYISKIKGDANAVAGVKGTIKSVPGTLPGADPSGKIPNRFLPANTQTDIDAGTDGHHKTFSIMGNNKGTGFVNHLVINHFPVNDPNFDTSGQITIGYNASTQPFTHSDAGCDPTAIHYITDSNINKLS